MIDTIRVAAMENEPIPSARRSARSAEHGEMGVGKPLLYRIPPPTACLCVSRSSVV